MLFRLIELENVIKRDDCVKPRLMLNGVCTLFYSQNKTARLVQAVQNKV